MTQLRSASAMALGFSTAEGPRQSPTNRTTPQIGASGRGPTRKHAAPINTPRPEDAGWGPEPHGSGPVGKSTLGRPPAQPQPAALTPMAGVCSALDQDNRLGRVTRLCLRGPVAYGSGPRGVGRGALDKAWLEWVEGAGIRRAGPTWAVVQEFVLGNYDHNHGSDWDKRHLLRSRIRPLLRVEMGCDRDPIPTQWIH